MILLPVTLYVEGNVAEITIEKVKTDRFIVFLLLGSWSSKSNRVLFMTRQSAIALENDKINESPMLYTCALCGKGYRNSKAHAQHLNSRAYIMRASQGADLQEKEISIVIPLQPRHVQNKRESDEESEWEEADQEEDLVGDATESVSGMNVDEDMDDDFELNPCCFFMCDQEHENMESCIVHMNKHHGFFIPDVEYLKDTEGLLKYLGLKVKRDYMCLYWNDKCHPFNSLEAVRKHMEEQLRSS